ncbi:protein SYM1 [Elsinoe australis]|uniref:Protein SYM1 n=1 Tax=Elsinoe australis TaxID=40998 RepID=A0A4U7AW76_9PEZI|nr:protein SYM1 [Elsinoe australis]
MASLDLIIKSTIQAVVLSGFSNILAQLLTAYQTNAPYRIDPVPTTRFIIFSLLSCPPNVLWQSWLEHTFPGYTTASSSSSSSSKQPPAKSPRKLNKRNTLAKFALDQTIGAGLNTVAFIAGMLLLRGVSDWGYIADKVREETLPLILAGQKLWPAVSLISFTVVPLEYRTLFGGLVGVGWGVYLSLVEGGKRH